MQRCPCSTSTVPETRRDQEEGGQLDSHEESWTFICGSRGYQEEGGGAGPSRRKLDSFAGPGGIKRREVVLDPQESPEEIKSREVELGSES